MSLLLWSFVCGPGGRRGSQRRSTLSWTIQGVDSLHPSSGYCHLFQRLISASTTSTMLCGLERRWGGWNSLSLGPQAITWTAIIHVFAVTTCEGYGTKLRRVLWSKTKDIVRDGRRVHWRHRLQHSVASMKANDSSTSNLIVVVAGESAWNIYEFSCVTFFLR